MRELQLKDAKATLSAVVDRAAAGEPTVITRHGRKEAVLISFEEWERISKVPSFADLLLTFPGEPSRRSKPALPARSRIGASTKAARLRRWLSALEHFYADRILPFGVEEARRSGALLDRARAHDPGFEDIAIAATAAVRGYTVLTANERHFAPLGVPLINPLKGLPASR